MRTSIALLLVGLCALAYAGPAVNNQDAGIRTNQYGQQYRVADKAFLERQRNILQLFPYLYQSNLHQDQLTIAKSFNIEQNIQQYGNQQIVREFLRMYQQGLLLPRGEVFSVFNEMHLNQTVALTSMLLNAQTYDIFYQTACWAREYVNEGMFVYAVTVAVLHRQDTQGIVLPAIYEINPYNFVNSEVINQAQDYVMRLGGNVNKDVHYIQANYSGWYLNADPEQYALSYFTEDVGLNAYYYYFNLDYPGWMGGNDDGLIRDRRGELSYYVHQQLLARYYLERLSNGYGNVPVFDWQQPLKTGYQSSLRLPNGLQLASRPAWSYLTYNPHNQAYAVDGQDSVMRVQEIEDYERRIRDAIDSGFVITEDGQKINIYEQNGFDLLARIVESNADSPNTRFYGNLFVLARQVLGYSVHPVSDYQVSPSVLEQFETSLRDPVFYQYSKRMMYYFLRYKANLASYTRQQLALSGVEIQNVHIDKLVTYFDNFDFDITNALYVNQQQFQQDSIHVRARQQRLNHLPYSYKINVQSEQAQDVVVRVFLGPRYDEQGRDIPLNENRVNFVELDQFVYSLQAGANTIERNSRQANVVRDRTSYRVLYQRVMNAIQGQEEFHLDMSEAHNGFPSRFMLPRGRVGGQVYQLYVYIGAYQPVQQQQQSTYDNVISAGVGSGARHVDSLALGFPLDRQIVNEQDFFVPNSRFEDVVIFHRQESEINTSRQE